MPLLSRPPSVARIISIGGGKGGVGKSIVAANLATVIAKAGKRVVLADLDLGAANQHLLLGIDQPRGGIDALLGRGTEDLAEALTATPIPNLKLLAGSGATAGAANITHGEKMRIIRKLRSLPAEVIIVDVGAGVGYNALDFFELGSQRVIVATPQVTSIHDAYSFLKGAVLRTLRHHAERTGDVALLEPATASQEGAKVSEILAHLKDIAPEFAGQVFEILKHFGAYMVGNQLTDPGQAGVFHAVSKMMFEYLGVSVPILGWVRSSPRVYESVNRRTPLTMKAHDGEEERTFQGIADALLVDDVTIIEEDDDVLLESEADAGSSAVPGMVPEAPLVSEAVSLSLSAPTQPAPPPKVPAVAEKVVPHVYVRPPHNPSKPEKKKRSVEDGRRFRRITLPGLTPIAAATSSGSHRSR